MLPLQRPSERRDKLYEYYATYADPDDLQARYEDLVADIGQLPFLAGFCYTQLTDIEHEVNGLLTYGRVPKVDPVGIAEVHARLLPSSSRGRLRRGR